MSLSFSQYCAFERAKNKRKLQAVLDKFFMTQVDLANELGVSKQCVHSTLNGRSNNSKVIDWFIGKGVSDSLLYDPRSKSKAA